MDQLQGEPSLVQEHGLEVLVLGHVRSKLLDDEPFVGVVATDRQENVGHTAATDLRDEMESSEAG